MLKATSVFDIRLRHATTQTDRSHLSDELG